MHDHRNQNNRVFITEKAREILRVFNVLYLVLDSYDKGVFTFETFVGCTHKISALSCRCYIHFKKVFVWCVCVCVCVCTCSLSVWQMCSCHSACMNFRRQPWLSFLTFYLLMGIFLSPPPLFPQELWDYRHVITYLALCEFWGSELRFSYFHSNHFAPEPPSQPLMLYFNINTNMCKAKNPTQY